MPEHGQMRAVQYDRYGDPSVLHVASVRVPAPAASEVLVRVAGASVNPTDLQIRGGKLRLVSGRAFPRGAGVDFAGTVAGTGSDVTHLRVGDPVWGGVSALRPGPYGALADFVAVDSRRLGPAPAGLDLVSAGALPAVGLSALIAVRNHLRVRPGQRLLVLGATGGVGTVAVQIGRHDGAEVVAVGNGDHLDPLLRLGATSAADYRSTPLHTLGTFDAVLDTVGAHLQDARRLVAPGGRMVTLAFGTLPAAVAVLRSSRHGSRRIRTFTVKFNARDLATLRDMVDSGAVNPVIQRVYELEDVAQAHDGLASGGSFGKHLVKVSSGTDQQ